VIQVLNSLLGGSIDFEKVDKLTADSGLDRSEVKAAIAALNFILSNSAKYQVDDATVSNELQQLGLPKEHCDSLAKPYRDNLEKLREKFSQQTLKLTRLDSVDWRVDYILASNFLQDVNAPTVQIKLNTKPSEQDQSTKETEYSFEITPDKLRVLLYELKSAQEYMENVL